MISLKSFFNPSPEPTEQIPVQHLTGRIERCAIHYVDSNSFALTILLEGAAQAIRLQGPQFTAGNYNELTQAGDEISIGIDANDFFCLDAFENITLKTRLGMR